MMFQKLEEISRTKGGRVAVWIGCALALGGAGYAAYSSIGGSPASVSAHRVFIDAETMKSFNCELKAGMTLPVASPYSGKNTGFPAEMCYWTKDGRPADDPTPVLLNSYKGSRDPTFCPDCGRLVVPHNPHPMPGSKPPPTAQEYRARFSQQEDP
jgi:hypothetical protein